MNIAAIKAAGLVAKGLSSVTSALDTQTERTFGKVISPTNVELGITGADSAPTVTNSYTLG